MYGANISHLETALVKSGTMVPMNRSSVMPVRPFYMLFEQMGCNESLTIRLLRLKCIMLLALTMMLRPSDIAPKAIHDNNGDLESGKFILSTDQVCFEKDGRLSITFFGIKNDTNREGFVVTIGLSISVCGVKLSEVLT